MSKNSSNLSALKFTRREKILNVAERLFSRQGYRATTMESVAAEVGMSKVTVYSYFRDKDELFESVANRLAERIKDVVQAELKSEGTLTERLTAALIAKHDLIFKLVRQSAFSTELFAAKDQFATAIFKDADTIIEKMLSDAIASNGGNRTHSKSIGRLLFGASTGIANHASNQAEMAQHITKLVNGIIEK